MTKDATDMNNSGHSAMFRKNVRPVLQQKTEPHMVTCILQVFCEILWSQPTRKFRKKLLKSRRKEGGWDAPWLRSRVSEGMKCAPFQERYFTDRKWCPNVIRQYLKLPIQNNQSLIFSTVNVRRRTTSWRCGFHDHGSKNCRSWPH